MRTRLLLPLLLAAAVWLVPAASRAQSRADSLLREQRRVLLAKPVIRSVTVIGNNAFPTSVIRARLHSKKTSFFDFLPLISAKRLRRDSDAQDSLALYNWYRSHGFLNAHIGITYRFHNDSRRTADVTVRIREGVQTLLAGYRVECPASDLSPEVQRRAESLQLNEPFNPFVVKQIQFDIKSVFANAGHPYCIVGLDTVFTPNRRQVRLTLRCEPGPEVHFGAVEIPTLRWTRPKAVRREVTFKKGDLYRRRSIIDSEQRLYSSGLFDYVSLEAKSLNGNSRDTLPEFEVRGIERKPIFLSAQTGAKQDENQDLVWSLAVAGGDRNFTGTGRQLRASAQAEYIVFTQWRALKYRFATAYTEPWPFNLRLPATLELAYEPGVTNAIQPYRIQRIEGNLSLFREWSRYTRTWLVFKYDRVDIFGIDPSLEEQFRSDQGINISRSITATRQRDTRDSPFLPSRGSFTNADAEFAGDFLGGDYDFIRLEGSWSRYFRLAESRNIIAHRIKFGYLDGIGTGDRVPAQERFFLGGANTVRGYKENSIGPKSSEGVPLGGELVIIGNLELRRPLIGLLWTSMFVDIGNIWLRPEDFRPSDWRVGAGAGLQFISPVGPIRLDYARRVIRDGEPPGGRLHLSILYAF